MSDQCDLIWPTVQPMLQPGASNLTIWVHTSCPLARRCNSLASRYSGACPIVKFWRLPFPFLDTWSATTLFPHSNPSACQNCSSQVLPLPMPPPQRHLYPLPHCLHPLLPPILRPPFNILSSFSSSLQSVSLVPCRVCTSSHLGL